MSFDQLLLTTAPWLAWAGVAFSVLTVIGFLAGWGLRFRLVGVSSFTFLLAISCWAFALSYSPPVVVEGAIRVPIVFDNGDDLVVAQAPSGLDPAAVANPRTTRRQSPHGAGRSSSVVSVRLRSVETSGDGVSRPVLLGDTMRDFRSAPIR